LLRGIVMVIMMLDHTREYVHYAALRFDPLISPKRQLCYFSRAG